MSKQTEAMKQALDALEYTTNLSRFLLNNEANIGPMLKADDAITALREALAEQPVATLYGSLPVYDKPAQQDLPDLIAGALGVSRGTAYDMMREALAEQPAREPLTDEQIRSIWSDGDCFEEVAFARAVEAAHDITKGNT